MEAPSELIELRKKLFGNIAPVFSKTANTFLSSIPNIQTTPSWKLYIIAALTIICAVLIVLILVHILITPIFPWKFTNIMEDGQVESRTYWEKEGTPLLSKDTIIGESSSTNYSIILDIGINSMTAIEEKKLPIIFYYGMPVAKSDSVTIAQKLNSNYSIAVALQSTIVNDLIISVLNANDKMENIIINNIPVGRGFRIGIVMSDHTLEVYLGGKLVKTRRFTAPPKTIVGGSFYPPDPSIAQVRNLILATSAISPSQIRKISSNPIAQFNYSDVSISNACIL